jgi:heme exporter protein D
MIPELGKYAGTVLWAYAASLLLIAGIVALSWMQARRVRRQLRALEERLKRNG